jgi:hypothetical protein
VTAALTRNQAQLQRPYCDCVTASQSPTSGSDTTADLPTTATVDNGLATTGTALLDGANNRIYLRRAGIWQLSALTAWTANATGLRFLRIILSTGAYIGYNTNNNFGATLGASQSTEGLVYVANATSYFTVELNQSSGAPLATTTTARAVWLGALS